MIESKLPVQSVPPIYRQVGLLMRQQGPRAALIREPHDHPVQVSGDFGMSS